MATKEPEDDRLSATQPSVDTIKLIMEAGLKLHLSEEAIASAATFYHTFCSAMTEADYDGSLIAMATLNLASKVQEHNTKLGDVVNTCHRCLHKTESPLEVSDTYWQLKESVAKCELLLLRALNFNVYLDLPHKYLLHHLLALSRWIDERVWLRSHVTAVAWALLQDSYRTTLCLRHPPNLLATAVLYLALHCCKLEVPGASQRKWWDVFCPRVEEKELQSIAKDIMAVHDAAAAASRHCSSGDDKHVHVTKSR